ncbi:RNase H domain-containing protein [Trichonephila clavipes]|nr:RNase H domain-containing protein [Trichonephila clavipes]
MRKQGFIDFNVDTSAPFSCITPIDSFNHVEFREVLLTSTPKHSSHPELLRQLALEVINDIPDQALIINTDVRLGQRKQVSLQCFPSHVGVPGNEAADELTGRGCDLSNPNPTVLTCLEIRFFQRNKMNLDLEKPSFSPLVRS